MALTPAASPHPVHVLGSGPWRSATFTTFALSLSFFESVILRQLRAAHCREVTVYVDPLGYRNSLIERQLIGAGCSYRLIPVVAPQGAFHLKFAYLQGEDSVDGDCLLVGSGNLTMGGYGNNAELIDVFLSRESPGIFAAFAQILDGLLTSHAVRLPVTTEMQSLRERAASVGSVEKNGIPGVQLVCSLMKPIGQAIVEEAHRLGGCQRITILSPFFESVVGVERLWLELDRPTLAIALPDSALQPSRFPFAKAKQKRLPVHAVSADPAFGRSFHAKLYQVECTHGTFLVTGSANATRPALWTSENTELAVFRRLGTNESAPIRWIEAPIPSEWVPPSLTSAQDQARCLFVELLSNRGLSGQIMNVRDPRGSWSWELVGRQSVLSVGVVEVGADGTFRIDDVDLSLEVGPAQLRLSRSNYPSVEGWVNQTELLKARHRFGAIIDPVLRTLSGEGDTKDLGAIITWLCREGISLKLKSKNKSKNTSSLPDGTPIPIALLEPATIPEKFEESLPGSGLTLLSNLLSSLRKRFRSASPPSEDDFAEDDDRSQKKREEARRRADTRYEALQFLIEDAQDELWKVVNDVETEPAARRTAAVWLLDLSLFVYLHRPGGVADSAINFAWLWLRRISRGFEAASERSDELDKAVVTTAAALATRSGLQTDSCRQIALMLQSYFKATLSDDLQSHLRQADVIGMEAIEVAPTADLASALEALRHATTDWQLARELYAAVLGGIELPSFAETLLPKSNSECAAVVKRLRRVLTQSDRPRLLGETDEIEPTACPRCNYGLPIAEQHMLQTRHVALCRQCDRVIFRTTP